MRVLQVVTDDDRRGAQVFGLELGTRLGELGFEVANVALAPGRVGGLAVECLGSTGLGAATLRRLRQEMAHADVTVAHGSTTLFACAGAGAGPSRRFVYRQISDPIYWTPTLAKRLRTGAGYRAARHVVALSPTTADVIRERFHVPVDRISVIPNAVDERRCRPATEADRRLARQRFGLPARPHAVVAYVGALAAEKGVDDLIDAIPSGVHLLVGGDGPYREVLRARAERRRVSCIFTGRLDDPWDVFAAADIVVLPSRGGDTHPAVLIEAALVGTVALSTPVGAIPDIVHDGETGRLVPPGDVEALRRVLDELLADEGERRRLEAAATTRARATFVMDVVARRWSDVLQRAAAR